jgi:hypothetical protein
MKINNIQKYIVSCTILLIALVLTAEVQLGNHQIYNNDQIEKTTNQESKCISPIFSFAYPVKSDDKHIKISKGEILPSDHWNPEATLPAFTEIGERKRDWLVAVRTIKNDFRELWVLRYWDVFSNINNSLSTKVEFLVFNTETKKWNSIPAQVKNSDAIAGELFFTDDGNIWAHNYWETYFTTLEPPLNVSKSSTINDKNISLFSRYDEKQNLFIEVEETKSIANMGVLKNSIKQYQEWNKILLDKTGMFWIFVQYDGIYNFDPKNLLISRLVDLPNHLNDSILIRSTALAADGSIFISDDYSSILHFEPKSKKLTRIGGMPLWFEDNYKYYSNILVDHAAKLWVGDIGWIESKNYTTWNQLIPSPIFITDNTDGKTLYAWEKPTIINESSDNLLWFTFSNGLVSLDPSAGVWCWVSTEHNNVVKDSQNSLWTIADDNLYQYK